MKIADIVEDVEHESAVSSTKLVYNQIMIWMVRELVVCDQVPSESFAVERTEKFGRRVPELSALIGILGIQLVLEIGVALPK